MKKIALVCFICILYISARSQTVVSQSVKRMPADTNIIAYDEQGKELRYYQYIKLLNTGQYKLISKGDPGTKAISYLKKTTPEDNARLYAIIKLRMAITSPLLQEGSVLDISPLLSAFKKKDLDNKAIVLIFWNAGCTPFTDSFSTLNDYFKDIADNKDIIIIALTPDDELTANAKLKETPLLYIHLQNNAQGIVNTYQLDSFPSYVVAGRDHIIRYALSGYAPMAMPMFRDVVYATLQK